MADGMTSQVLQCGRPDWAHGAGADERALEVLFPTPKQAKQSGGKTSIHHHLDGAQRTWALQKKETGARARHL